jgi:hypothetical protein
VPLSLFFGVYIRPRKEWDGACGCGHSVTTATVPYLCPSIESFSLMLKR